MFTSYRTGFAGIMTILAILTGFSCKMQNQDEQTLHANPPLEKLLQGNDRFARMQSTHPHADMASLKNAARGQHPIAVVLSCSDSRVSPELVFDQGIGDLFVIRTAGNIISGIETGSIEYAVEHLHVPLILIMGHENCGAVKAYVEGGEAHGHITEIIDSLAQEAEIKNVPSTDNNRVDKCVVANVLHGIKQLQLQSPLIREKVQQRELMIAGARYDLDDLTVKLIATSN